MERRGPGRRDSLFGFGFGFGDPFAGFGGLRMPGIPMPSFFERDPFDDPFFSHPFGSMMSPSIFAQSMFGARANPSGDSLLGGFLEDEAPRPKRSRGPIIEQLPSDDEEQHEKNEAEKKDNPHVEEPAEETGGEAARSEGGKRTRHEGRGSYSFQSSTVTYGGLGGSYYTSSTTRRMGGDGVTVEEKREADATTGKAAHRISRAIREKGHSVTRNLDSSGRVDTVQTLLNMGEDELAGFEETWRGQARRHLPGWNLVPEEMYDADAEGGRDGGRAASRGWALPAASPAVSSRARETQAANRPSSSSEARPR